MRDVGIFFWFASTAGTVNFYGSTNTESVSRYLRTISTELDEVFALEQNIHTLNIIIKTFTLLKIYMTMVSKVNTLLDGGNFAFFITSLILLLAASI